MEQKKVWISSGLLIDLGSASRNTRGFATLFPWYEGAPTPYNRRCLTC